MIIGCDWSGAGRGQLISRGPGRGRAGQRGQWTGEDLQGQGRDGTGRGGEGTGRGRGRGGVGKGGVEQETVGLSPVRGAPGCHDPVTPAGHTTPPPHPDTHGWRGGGGQKLNDKPSGRDGEAD